MFLRLFAALLLGLAATATAAHAQTQGRRADVVVELYTSQGCTQCPRANRLLDMLSREEGVLALTLPVGIWDYLGWHDTFARPEFSERQRAYSRAMRVRGRFTPQLIINGSRQISASYWDEARATFDQSRRAGWPAGASNVDIARLRNGRVRVTVATGSPGANADVWLMAYDPGPLVVFITRGLNTNRTVAHYNLVRSIERLDTWNGRSAWYERARCLPECAVIIQEPNGGRILAAAYTGQSGRR